MEYIGINGTQRVQGETEDTVIQQTQGIQKIQRYTDTEIHR